jgi:rSAM/selenodomain-associated transferase 2
MLSISIIIPTLNEENSIQQLLNYLIKLDTEVQIIVSDGGSRDRTVQKAEGLVTVTQSSKGRGIQMNTGAQLARGEVLWFIHADCVPHPKSVHAIQKSLKDQDVVGGGFEYMLDHPARRFRVAEYFSNLKNRRMGLLFGDMGIFVRRKIFESMGGYNEIPLMEDMDLSRRLKKMGTIVVLPHKMKTSARRWIEEGYLQSSARSWILQTGWSLGVSPDHLAKWYRFH